MTDRRILDVADCRVIVADYVAMREVLGPRDFDGFCAGYLDHSTWLATRGNGSIAARSVAIEKSREGGATGTCF